ncbi:MAG TPA: hypothetical protein PKX99_10025 [Thermoanaerobaculia bacterium]|nr:hypothetical protein [Thermoanaerobaculia bacterium]HRS37002.1 hypothetical protein [Thermoanaerobaculia bacterium]HRU10898.1 hypothetical protein [Thermoanaerobaculia bacterium]
MPRQIGAARRRQRLRVFPESGMLLPQLALPKAKVGLVPAFFFASAT